MIWCSLRAQLRRAHARQEQVWRAEEAAGRTVGFDSQCYLAIDTDLLALAQGEELAQ